MVVWLRIVSGASQGQATQLANRQFVVLGRTIRADIVLKDDPRISGEHCRIENDGVQVHLKDLGSTNGTFLNGQNVREAQLQNGDQLRIGGTEILVDFQGSHAPSDVESGEGRETLDPPPYQQCSNHAASVADVVDRQAHDASRAEPPSALIAGGMPTGGSSSLPPIYHYPQAPTNEGRSNDRMASIDSDGHSEIFASPKPRSPSPPPPPAAIPDQGPTGQEVVPSRLGSIELPETRSRPQPASAQLPGGDRLPSAQQNSLGTAEDDDFSSVGESLRNTSANGPASGSVGHDAENAPLASRPMSPLESFEDSSLFSPASNRQVDVASYSDHSSGESLRSTGESLRSTGGEDRVEADFSSDGAAPEPRPVEPREATESRPALAQDNDPSAGNVNDPSAGRANIVLNQTRYIAAVPANAKHYTTSSCPGDLTCFKSLPADQLGDDFFASGMVDLIASQSAAVAILHFQKIQLETPAELGSVAVPLLDWLPTDSAFQFGPVMVPYKTLHELGKVDYLDQLWTHDGCLILLGQDLTALAEYSQELMHREIPGLTGKGGIFQYCWPTVLGQLLASQSTEVTRAIMGGTIDAVLLEPTPADVGWQIFAAESFEQTLRACGCRPLQP